MISKIVKIMCALAVLTALPAMAAATTDKMPKDFKGGNSAEVKTWTNRTFESVKSTPGAYCIYIYDADKKANLHAYHIEGKEMLGSSEVKEALSKFIKVKVPNNAKGWPEQWMKDAEGGASLVFISGTMMPVFDKKIPAAEFTAAAVVATAKAVRANQDVLDKAQKAKDKEKEKEAAEKAKKEEKDVAVVKDPTAIPGLDTKKPDPKLAGKKPDPKGKADEKKPADAKAADPKDPKKKTPDDE